MTLLLLFLPQHRAITARYSGDNSDMLLSLDKNETYHIRELQQRLIINSPHEKFNMKSCLFIAIVPTTFDVVECSWEYDYDDEPSTNRTKRSLSEVGARGRVLFRQVSCQT